MLSLLVIDETPRSGVLYSEHDGRHILVVPAKPDIGALRYALDFVLPEDLRETAVYQLIARQVATPASMDGALEI